MNILEVEIGYIKHDKSNDIQQKNSPDVFLRKILQIFQVWRSMVTFEVQFQIKQADTIIGVHIFNTMVKIMITNK